MNQVKQLNIKNAEAYELATELASLTGASLTTVVVEALKEKLERDRRSVGRDAYIQRLLAHGERYRALPDRDTRSAEEVVGYDENGLPT